MKKYIADTYAWIAYFEKNEAYRGIIEETENRFKTPAVVFAELARIFLRKRLGEKEVKELLEFVRDRSIVMQIGYAEAARAGQVAWKEKMPLVDSLIYAHASPEEPVLTGDEHFKNKPNVEFVK
ncbi:MAG: PIN domain-containing protein [Candidatus Micrarchaeota archaeon]|nr:PIN domain-containing protein [Candidatus Micrarchaeota archaeon]